MLKCALQINKLLDELEQYQESNKKLQPTIDIEKYFNGLSEKDNSYLKSHIRDLSTQTKELKYDKHYNQQKV